MLFAGIRPGELCAIRWNDFDQTFSSLRIDESLTDAMFESSTKTESSERIIPLTSFLQKQYSEMYEFKNPQFDDYVFINRCGRPYKTNNVDKKFRYIRKGSIFYKINLSQINYSLYNLDCIFYKISREMHSLPI